MIRADKLKKNEDMPLVRRKGISNNSSIGVLEKTHELKKFYQRNMPAYPIENMIEIREKAL